MQKLCKLEIQYKCHVIKKCIKVVSRYLEFSLIIPTLKPTFPTFGIIFIFLGTHTFRNAECQ